MLTEGDDEKMGGWHGVNVELTVAARYRWQLYTWPRYIDRKLQLRLVTAETRKRAKTPNCFTATTC